MKSRPEYEIELTSFDMLLEVLGWAVMLVLWVYTIFSYASLPEIIPTHFNGAGVADDFGSKDTIWLLPTIASVIFVGMTILNRYPHIFNYPTAITEENALRQYTYATRMIRFLKLATTLLFAGIAMMIGHTATNGSHNLSTWFLPVSMGLIFIPIFFYLFKSLKRNN